MDARRECRPQHRAHVRRAGREGAARGPPLWTATDAERDPAADPLLQPAPAFEFDQRIAW
jgi:hypothetical protein